MNAAKEKSLSRLSLTSVLERFSTRATHIQCCPRQPRKFLLGSLTVKFAAEPDI
jgi:hypothetical protein